MRALNFNVIKLTFCLVLGILIGHYFKIPFQIVLSFSVLCLLLLSIVYLINKKSTERTSYFGLTAFFTFVCIGITTYTFQNPKSHGLYYANQIEINPNSSYNIKFRVREIMKPTSFHDKYVIQLLSINKRKVKGKVLLNIQKDSTAKNLRVDDIVAVRTKILDLADPLNPHQFNYKDYLARQYIYNQLFATNYDLLILDSKKHTLFGYADKIRQTINESLNEFSFQPNELAIINALLLGQRQNISKDIYEDYSQAGAIHILAVSGLHVGIILLILNFILKPLELLSHGNKIKIILIVMLLWSFAVVAGLSASVTRAVTMFSVVAFGMNLKRATNIYNTLAISMFILLLFKPLFLFDVGFQLSYLAVFSIVWIQPLLYHEWRSKFWIMDKFWQIFTVTIAAQFGILPLSLFYFHQFPGLFFITNLLILPFLGLILGLGLLIIGLAVINLLPNILASIYGYIISLMNGVVSFISEQEAFLFKDISFNIILVFSSYFLIVSFVVLYRRKTYKDLFLGLIALAVFISAFVYNKYSASSNEFIIFHKPRYTMIGNKFGRYLKLDHNLNTLTIQNETLIRNYKVGAWIKRTETDSIKSVYQVGDNLLLVVDSLGVYKTSFKPDYILLTNSPKINLEKLIDHLKPKLIIADGSNYKTYQERWKSTCVKQKIPFHQTSEKGALIIN